MSNIQESITSITKEHDARRHLAVIVCMIAVATVLAVFWSLHIKGITLSSGDLICGMEEHTHTSDCYAWVPVEDETENGSELEETESVSETEDDAESETASETEESTDTETATGTELAVAAAANSTEAASETVTESATESVSTEMGTEALTEDGSEALTEEETETAQVGDTKVIDGVEYVYTLICGMEEHTHTDECYADEELEETETEEDTEEEISVTAGVATLGVTRLGSSGPSAGVSAASVEEESNNGISVASSGDLGSTGNTTSDYYYFADKVTASEALSNPGDYVIYTEIDGSYYLVDGNGSLSLLTNQSTDDGVLSWYSDNDIDYYKWALSKSSSLNYLYNESYSHYLSPSTTKTVSASTMNNTYTELGSILDGQTLAITVTGAKNRDTLSTFYVSLYSEAGGYIQTRSTFDNNSTSAGTLTTTLLNGTAGINEFAINMTYIVLITRNGSDYTITYYDKTNDKVKMIVTVTDSALMDDATIRFYMGRTSYDLSVDVVTDVTETSNYTTTTSTDATTVDNSDDGVTLTNERTSLGAVTLAGDFDITYNFTNYGNVGVGTTGNWNNYLITLTDSDGQIAYVRSDAQGWIVDSSANYYYSWDNSGNSYFTITTTFDNGYTWNDWANAMNSGASMEVNVKWVSSANTLTVTATGAYATIVTVVDLSSFNFVSYGSDTVTVALTGDYCTLSNITRTDNSIQTYAYDTLTYTVSDSLYLINYSTTKQEITITAGTDYDWTGSYTNSSGTVWNLFAELNSVNAVEWITSDGTALTNSNASATCSGGTVTIGSTEGSVELRFARIRSFTAFFDGSNGGTYTGFYHVGRTYHLQEDVTSYKMDSTGSNFYVDIPSIVMVDTDYSGSVFWDANSRQNMVISGWYDIYNNTYYSNSGTITFPYSSSTDMTVLYGDWSAKNYDGGNSSDTYYSDTAVDTSNFITTNVFDYNDLFNMYSAGLTSTTTSASGYTFSSFGTSVDQWTVSYSGNSVNNILGTTGWGFLFIGSSNYSLLNPISRGGVLTTGRETVNTSKDEITEGILSSSTVSSSLLTYLFDTDEALYGKTYLGKGDLLYQYSDDTGYYYFDSSLNAAFYNQSDKRFYLYQYTVATSATGSTSDFIPFNYDEIQTAISSLQSSEGSNIIDAYITDGTSVTLAEDSVDYYFGISSAVSFYLPDSVNGAVNGSTGGLNQTTDETYTDMVFKFSGDDDVWVYLDYGTTNSQLLLDLGGVHGEVYGEIDFSTGIVKTVNTKSADDGTAYVEYDSNGIIGLTAAGEAAATSYEIEVEEGSHTLTMLYLERGASQSNAAIYFNIAPVYTVKLAKVVASGSGSSTTSAGAGVTFNVYTSSDFENSTPITTATTDADGVLTIDELVPGTVYYLVETNAPAGYPLSQKYITVYADSAGSVTVCVYSSSGELIETLSCVVGEDDYNGTDAIEDIIKSNDYSVFSLTTTSSGDGVEELLLVDDTDSSNTYLLNNLSVFGATNTKYSTYLIATMTYANYEEYELPSAGSTGIVRYLFIGETLVVIAIIGLIFIAFYQFVWIRRFSAMKNNKEYTRGQSERSKHFAWMRGHPRERSITHGHARDRPGDR